MAERHPALVPDIAPEAPHNENVGVPFPEVVDPGQLIVSGAQQTVADLKPAEHALTSWRQDPRFQDESWAFDDNPPEATPHNNPVANRLAAHGWKEHPAVRADAVAPAHAPEAQVRPPAAASQIHTQERRGRFWRRRQSEPTQHDEHADFWAPIK